MKIRSRFACLSMLLLALSCNSMLQAGSPEYKPELFKNTKLVYEDTFDGPLNPDFWEGL
jgi:hypothetical protein